MGRSVMQTHARIYQRLFDSRVQQLHNTHKQHSQNPSPHVRPRVAQFTIEVVNCESYEFTQKTTQKTGQKWMNLYGAHWVVAVSWNTNGADTRRLWMEAKTFTKIRKMTDGHTQNLMMVCVVARTLFTFVLLLLAAVLLACAAAVCETVSSSSFLIASRATHIARTQ